MTMKSRKEAVRRGIGKGGKGEGGKGKEGRRRR